MSIVTISERDFLRSKLVKPAWYRVRIDTHDEKMAASGTSTNYILEGTILHNADTGDKEFAGVPTPYWQFNSSGLGFTIGFWESLGADVKPNSRFDWDNTHGKELDVFIGNDTYQGRLVNSVKTNQYRRPRSAE